MDEWMRRPGARVVGHRAGVRAHGGRVQTSCSCGHPFAAQTSVPGACLALVQHLQTAVREGAAVGPGDDDGSAGVREPRRPVPSPASGSAEAEIA